MRFAPQFALAALAIPMALAVALSVTAAQAQDVPPTLTVTGQGSAAATPDLATVMTGVESFAPTAARALSENSEQMALVFQALTDAGIDARDMQTSNLSVQPRYSNTRNNEPLRIEGYQVRNGVTVRIREVKALGTILDALVATGANRIDAVSFGFNDPSALREQARIDAVADARKTAETYAAAAGVSLGRILSISDGSTGPSPLQNFAMAEMSRAAVPIAAGESSISNSVRIVWELVQD